MSPPREPALSAPDLIGPTSILDQPTQGPRAARRRRNRPYSHVHLEIDLARAPTADPKVPVLERLEEVLGIQEVVESADLIRLTGGTLHALSARGFRRVDHWEVSPGGWLPLPEPSARPGTDEPVGQLLAALASDEWRSLAQARSFSVRLSALQGKHADVVVRRTHRPGHHSLSLDLRGVWTREEVAGVRGALAERLPVEHSEITKFQYATGK